MSAPELKPCPFCGGKKLDAGYNEFGGLVTLCANCEAHGPSSEADKEQILAAWNTRADLCDPTQDERVKRLVDALQAWDEYDKGSDDGPNAGVQMMLDYDRAMRLTRAALRDMGGEGMTDKDKIKQMEDANWKPSNQHWKDKAEKLQKDLDILSLPDPNILILSEKVDQLQKDLTRTALDYLAADGQAAENYNRALDAEEKLNEALAALQKVQAFVKDLEPYADQGHTLVPSLRYACEVYNKLKGDT